MLWPFKRPKNRLKTPTGPSQRTIEAIYGMIVAQARQPVFYSSYAVPDTVNGRFDMVVLHLWLVLRRIRGTATAQALFDRFCSDMDANLREMGVGDLTVPKRMHKYAEQFYGRIGAYDAALETGDAELAAALARNVLVSPDAALAQPLAGYVKTGIAALDKVEPGRIENGLFTFVAPPPRAATSQPEAS